MKVAFAIVTKEALLIVRLGSRWSVEIHLNGQEPESIAVDPGDPTRIYVGTWGNGLWRSQDGGGSWESAGEGIPHDEITAVAVSYGKDSKNGTVYAGTEPSTISRSEDGGDTWSHLGALLDLPSSSGWSFPPKPETHHVRWIEPDPNEFDKLYVAIEAGALVQSPDRGESWTDRVRGGPIDTHTASTHRHAKGRIYSSAGDGYFESHDGGESWSRLMDGLRHRYLVGVAVDPGDPETVVVSAASGPYLSYRPGNAEAYVYRKTRGGPFELAMEGLPEAMGTVASRLATHPQAPGVFFAANNRGLFRSEDAGQTWEALEIDWPEGVFRRGVDALGVFAS
jgi:photosystem II stability/assembly factor-like uncharacterized protein